MPIAKIFERHGGGERILSVAASYERRFNIRFDSFVYFDADLLARLHAPGPIPDVVPASAADRRVIDQMATITTVANLAGQTDDDRLRQAKQTEGKQARMTFQRFALLNALWFVMAMVVMIVMMLAQGRFSFRSNGCSEYRTGSANPPRRKPPPRNDCRRRRCSSIRGIS